MNLTKDSESKIEVSLSEFLDIEKSLNARVERAIKYKNHRLSRYTVISTQ